MLSIRGLAEQLRLTEDMGINWEKRGGGRQFNICKVRGSLLLLFLVSHLLHQFPRIDDLNRRKLFELSEVGNL
jgi:hypothetical protein